jgi:acyl dehydratase
MIEAPEVTVDLSEYLALCNQDLPQPEQNYYEVTADAIRHTAYATFEHSALYLDEEFAHTTRWGGIIAPPGYLYSHGARFLSWPRRGGRITDSSGLEFDLADNMGDEWDLRLPVRPGDRIVSHSRPTHAIAKHGPRMGLFALVTSESQFTNQRGEVVAVYRGSSARWSSVRQRPLGAMAASYPRLAPGQASRNVQDSPWQLDRPRRYDRHTVYFDDVTDGLELPELVIGPLNTSETRRWEMRIGDMCRPESGGSITGAGHVPDFYAAGVLRVPWFGSLLTRWAGPDAWISQLGYRNREWVLVGYRYFCRGTVSRTYEVDGRGYVECELRMDNELGTTTNTGHAVVELPSR